MFVVVVFPFCINMPNLKMKFVWEPVVESVGEPAGEFIKRLYIKESYGFFMPNSIYHYLANTSVYRYFVKTESM